MASQTPPRVLVAKVGLDGHDRGIKVVARLLRDAGFEVIYSGLFQTPESVASIALQEDVDAIGLSILSGAHMTLAPRVVEEVRAAGLSTPVVLGGIILPKDVAVLEQAGVAAILGTGASQAEIVEVFSKVIERALPTERLPAASPSGQAWVE